MNVPFSWPVLEGLGLYLDIPAAATVRADEYGGGVSRTMREKTLSPPR